MWMKPSNGTVYGPAGGSVPRACAGVTRLAHRGWILFPKYCLRSPAGIHRGAMDAGGRATRTLRSGVKPSIRASGLPENETPGFRLPARFAGVSRR